MAASNLRARFLPFIFIVLAFYQLCYLNIVFKQPKMTILRSISLGLPRNNIKSGARLPSRPICVWTKHGHLCYLLPWKDITIYMDVELNPGPDNTARNYVHSDISALSSHINPSTSISTEDKNLLNSSSGLPSLPLYYSHFTRSTISVINGACSFGSHRRYRGRRSGMKVKLRESRKSFNIQPITTPF